MMIKVAFSGWSKFVYATVFGQWAVHRNVEPLYKQRGRSPWVVTHVPSGMSPISSDTIELTHETAIRIARRLALFVDDIGRDGLPSDTDAKYQIHAIYGEAMAEEP